MKKKDKAIEVDFSELLSGSEIWLHEPTFTIAYVCGDFGEFKFNGRSEQSYWGIFREERGHGWIKIGDA